MSKIEWTGATWNPLVGCTIHSSGCKGCYAMGEAWRKMHHPNPKIAAKFAGTARKVKGRPVWTGRINFSPDALMVPLRRRTPTTYFVNSLSDLFHASISDAQIDQVFAVMALCPQHRFQVLTKRADRMRAYFSDRHQSRRLCDPVMNIRERWLRSGKGKLPWIEGGRDGPLPNVWLGVSVEDQRAADERIPDLLATPAAVRFLSCEPLIGPVHLWPSAFLPCPNSLDGLMMDPSTGQYECCGKCDFTGVGDECGIDWVICGGESGKDARPMHPDWARTLRDDCKASGVPFFFKQWGEWSPVGRLHDDAGDTDETIAAETALMEATRTLRDGSDWIDPGKLRLVDDGMGNWANECAQPPASSIVIKRVGKKAAGRLLDGEQHDGMPEAANG